MVDIILYICSTKFKKMKKTGILFVAAAALTVASCSSADEAKNEEVVAVTYTLDKENSKLSWTGSATDHDQAGTVRFSQGTVTPWTKRTLSYLGPVRQLIMIKQEQFAFLKEQLQWKVNP